MGSLSSTEGKLIPYLANIWKDYTEISVVKTVFIPVPLYLPNDNRLEILVGRRCFLGIAVFLILMMISAERWKMMKITETVEM